MGSKMLRNRHQIGRQTLGTDVVQALGDHPQRVVELGTVGSPPLSAAFTTLNLATPHMANEGLAIQASDVLHLVQQPAAANPVQHPVSRLAHPQVFVAFVNGHLFVFRHGPLGDIII